MSGDLSRRALLERGMWVVGGAAASGVLAACSSGRTTGSGGSSGSGGSPTAAGPTAASSSSSLRTIKIGLNPNTDSAILFTAVQKGFMAKEGLKVTLVDSSSSTETNTALLSGSIDLVASAADNVLSVQSKGQDIVELVDSAAHVGHTLYMSKKLGIAPGDVAACKGRKIAVAGAGGGEDRFCRYALTNAGLDPDKDVSIIYIDETAKIAAIQSGRVDGAWGTDPYATQAVNELKIATAVMYVPTNGPTLLKTYPGETLQTTTKWLTDNKSAALGVISAMVAAGKMVKSDPTLAIDSCKLYFPTVSSELLGTIVKKVVASVNPVISPLQVNDMNVLLKGAGDLSKTISYSAAVAGPEFRAAWTA